MIEVSKTKIDKQRASLPVITGELADGWIYGIASDPIKLATVPIPTAPVPAPPSEEDDLDANFDIFQSPGTSGIPSSERSVRSYAAVMDAGSSGLPVQFLVHEAEGGAQKMTIRANKAQLGKELRVLFGGTRETLA